MTKYRILYLGAMVAIGVGVILIAVAIRDTWRSAVNVAHAANSASNLVAVPTAIGTPWTFSYGVPIVSDYVIEVNP